MLLRVVAQSLKPVKLFSQQLPTFLLFRDRRRVCTPIPTLLGPRTFIMYGLQRFIGCILPTMHCRSQHWWDCVASVCTALPTCTQQLPTLLAQQCWELLRPFARSLRHGQQASMYRWFSLISGDTSNNGEINKCWWTNKRANELSFVCRPQAWRRWRNVKTTYFLTTSIVWNMVR